jgi:hypothetical protein
MEGGVRKMLWGKKSVKEEEKKEKLPVPKEIPEPVRNHLVAERKMDPELVPFLKAVVRKSAKGERVQDIRVFDPAEAEAKKVQVKDYTSLDEHPDLIIYEGWFDEVFKKAELEEKKKVISNVPILTKTEIQQKVEGLSEPGSTVFFYMARGSAHGGPLGMGAAVIELNPNYPGKKQKKYNVYIVDVVDMQPVGKGQKSFDFDKPKDIARWIKGAHHKRMY